MGKASIFSYAQDSGDGRAEATEKRRWTEERRRMPNKDVVISRCVTDFLRCGNMFDQRLWFEIKYLRSI